MNRVLSILKVLLFEYVLSIVLLLLVALIMYKTGMSNATAKILILLVYFITTFIGGMVMAKAQNQKRLIWGGVSGLIYLAVLVIVAMIIKSELACVNNIVTASICCMAGGAIGGIVS
ncbi:MAG: TIGR04086 family membrane protein [Lachnospiraceae bacterium]